MTASRRAKAVAAERIQAASTRKRSASGTVDGSAAGRPTKRRKAKSIETEGDEAIEATKAKVEALTSDERGNKKAPATRHDNYHREARSDTVFGLVQERYHHNLYHLVVQAILWNQTRGKQALIVLEELLRRYPNAETLAKATVSDLESLLYPIGLYKQRAKRLMALGEAWIADPPAPGKKYKARAREYEQGDDGDGEPGWEIAHLPGVGPYALDSYRIFYRDQLRGLASGWNGEPAADGSLIKATRTDSPDTKEKDEPFEPEWKRVVPLDKDLRAFLIWAWRREGFEWDPRTGKKRVQKDATVAKG